MFNSRKSTTDRWPLATSMGGGCRWRKAGFGPMDVVTLVIAVLGLVLSVVSICWQVAQHFLSGPRVRAELLWGGLGPGRVVTGPIQGSLNAFSHAGVTTPIFAVQGRNHGRLPIDITGFSVELEGAGALSIARWDLNPTLPYRLDSGSERSFYIQMAEIEIAIGVLQSTYRGRLRARLDLASGDQALSGWSAFTSPNATTS